MYKIASALLVTIGLIFPAVAAAQQQPQQDKSEHVDIKQIAGYVDKLDLKYEVNEEKNVLRMPIAGDNARFNIVIIADTKLDVAYIAIVDYLKVPPKHRNCDKVLRRLMELNWEFNIGKFEWDSSDGEVRLTYTFCTDDGLGFKAFASALATLVAYADDYYPQLTKLLASE